MDYLKLKEAMGEIQIRPQMQEEIIMNVKKQTGYGWRRSKRLKKTIAAAAAFALIFGASIPIQAGIRYLIKERMESIPEQELEDTRQMLQSQDNVEADRFTREYSRDEKIRMQRLEKAYQHGNFPEQTITMTDSYGQIPEDSLSYITDSGIFHLPDRPLTDEELLQIIDLHYRTDYALAKSTAAQKEQRSQALEEERLKTIVKDQDMITSQEAQKKAETYLKTEFGLFPDGMEWDIFLSELPDQGLVYHVSFQTQDDEYLFAYGIDVRAEDGSLVDTSQASLPQK